MCYYVIDYDITMVGKIKFLVVVVGRYDFMVYFLRWLAAVQSKLWRSWRKASGIKF